MRVLRRRIALRLAPQLLPGVATAAAVPTVAVVSIPSPSPPPAGEALEEAERRALKAGIAAFLQQGSAGAPTTSRQLRLTTRRLVGALRARGYGFPEPETAARGGDSALAAALASLPPRSHKRLLAQPSASSPHWSPAPSYGTSEVGAYARARLPGTLAALGAALPLLRRPGWAPASLLDWGAGPGTGALAAGALWPGSLQRLVHVERSAPMRALGDALWAARDAERRRPMLIGDGGDGGDGRDGPPLAGHGEASPPLLPTLPRPLVVRELPPVRSVAPFDVVVACYALGELPPGRAAAVACALWRRVAPGGALALLEPGTPRGSALVRAARAAVLSLAGRGGGGAESPVWGAATVVAPCPGPGACPMDAPPHLGATWCHFAVPVARAPAGRAAAWGGAGGRALERFSYVLLRRADAGAAPVATGPGGAPAPAPTAGRLLRPPRLRPRHVVLTACTRPVGRGGAGANAIVESVVPHAAGAAYAAARAAAWGDPWGDPVGKGGEAATP